MLSKKKSQPNPLVIALLKPKHNIYQMGERANKLSVIVIKKTVIEHLLSGFLETTNARIGMR